MLMICSADPATSQKRSNEPTELELDKAPDFLAAVGSCLLAKAPLDANSAFPLLTETSRRACVLDTQSKSSFANLKYQR